MLMPPVPPAAAKITLLTVAAVGNAPPVTSTDRMQPVVTLALHLLLTPKKMNCLFSEVLKNAVTGEAFSPVALLATSTGPLIGVTFNLNRAPNPSAYSAGTRFAELSFPMTYSRADATRPL